METYSIIITITIVSVFIVSFINTYKTLSNKIENTARKIIYSALEASIIVTVISVLFMLIYGLYTLVKPFLL